jgi:hypothetical protein
MNTYYADVTSVDGAGIPISLSNILSAITIGSALSLNFQTVRNDADDLTRFRFDLPFSLSQLGFTTTGYDTRFQNVKEFLDKPYAVAGRVVAFFVDTTVGAPYDFKRDMDNYIYYPAVGTIGGKQTDLYIGICNGTLTESYAPFGTSAGAMGAGIIAIKFFDKADLALAQLQDIVATATGGGTPTSPAGTWTSPNSPRGGNSTGAIPTSATMGGRQLRPMLTSRGIVYQ